MSQARQLLDRRGWAVVVVLVVFWALSVMARLLWNGEVYGLNYGVLHGDGACYSLSAFTYAGDPDRGIREIDTAYAEAGVPIVDLTDPDVCDSIKLGARILYPLLSAPFVMAIGLEGMFVVPAVSWLLAVIVPSILLVRRGFVLGALLAGSLALASSSIARWSVANITDALLMGLAAIMLALLPLNTERNRPIRLVGIALLVVLASLTRQSWPIWIAMVAAPWLVLAVGKSKLSRRSAFRWANPWFALVITVVPVALGSHLAISAMFGSQNAAHLASVVEREVSAAIAPTVGDPRPAVAPSRATELDSQLADDVSGSKATGSSERSTFESTVVRWRELVVYVGRSAALVAITDVGQLVVLDRGLLVLLGLSLLGAYFNRRWSASYAYLGVFGATVAMSLLNTTLGVNFRFQLPAVPFIVLLAGVTLVRAKVNVQEHSSYSRDAP